MTNIPTPYRLPLYQLLSQHPRIDLDVVFNAAGAKNRHWELPDQFDFRYRVLPGRTISIWRDDLIAYHINFGAARWLRQGFDAVIVGGYESLAQQATIVRCHHRGIPLLVWTGSTAREPSLRRNAVGPLVRKLLTLASGYIAYGTAARNYLEVLGASSEQITVAYNTVDLDRFAAAVTADALPPELWGKGRVTVLYVGQLIWRKGVDLLLRAFANLQTNVQESALILVGSGPLEAELKGDTAALNLRNVYFVGDIPHQQLPSYYAVADVVVLPSRSEVWGLTVNEAMAAARPVIVSDAVGASKDLVKHGETGWVFRNGSIECLSACLVQCVCMQKDQRLAMGHAGQNRVFANFNLEQAVESFVSAVDLAQSRRQ